VGRLAQLGFAASLIGEGLTGKGILGQIGLEVQPHSYLATGLCCLGCAFVDDDVLQAAASAVSD
jgi:hypothetical protein